MGTDIKKLNLAESTSPSASSNDPNSVTKAAENQLRHADLLIDEARSRRPSILDGRARKEYKDGVARLMRTRFETIEVQMQGVLEQCRIINETAGKVARVAAHTLVNQLEQAAHVQRVAYADAAYRRVFVTYRDRLQFVLRDEDKLPEEFITRELRRSVLELERDLKAIDAAADVDPLAVASK